MTDLSRDPIVNVVQRGIKGGIRVALENDCYAAAVILIYSGIDTMAYLDMPAGQEETTRQDFVNWADRYIRFQCKEQLTGWDLYGARCGMLHAYTSASRLSREGKCRQIGYVDRLIPEVRYDPSVSSELVVVSLPALAHAFFDGVDRFLVDLFADSVKASVGEKRFRKLVHTLPYEPPSDGAE